MKTIPEIAHAKIESMVQNGEIEKKIEEAISGSITSAIDELFRSYGSMTKEIEKTLEQGLKISSSAIDFESYNEQMLVFIRAKLANFFQEQAAEKFDSQLNEMLGPIPEQITLKEFVERIVQFWREDRFLDWEECDEFATVELSERDASGDSYTLKMWHKVSERFTTARRREDIHLYILGNQIRINHHHNYNPTCFDAVEAYIFRLYSAGTVITDLETFDEDYCNLALGQNLE